MDGEPGQDAQRPGQLLEGAQAVDPRQGLHPWLWTLRTLESLEAHLHLETIGCTVPLADVYERIVFPHVD